MGKLNLIRRLKTLSGDVLRRSWSQRTVSTILLLFVFLFLLVQVVDKHRVELVPGLDESLFEVNSFGSNVDLVSLGRVRVVDPAGPRLQQPTTLPLCCSLFRTMKKANTQVYIIDFSLETQDGIWS